MAEQNKDADRQDKIMDFSSLKVRQHAAALLIAFILGAFSLGLYRFATYGVESVHYHANFGVYVNGEQDIFEDYSFYQELESCSLDIEPTAKERTHIHQPDNDVVHVHSEAVTWGHFFETLGYSIGDNHFATRADVHVQNTDTIIFYILNGELVGSPEQQHIVSEDKFAVVVGGSEQQAMELYRSASTNASEFNASSDPGACTSNEGHSVTSRLKTIFQ